LDFPASFLFIKKQLSADNREFAAWASFAQNVMLIEQLTINLTLVI
jgi:hypothetical protein